jgi:hypothetical protein
MKISLRATTCGLILAISAGVQPAKAEVYATLASNSSLSATYDPLAQSPPAAPAAMTDAATSSSSCDSCGGDVCYTNRSSSWTCNVGVEATYLQPITHDVAVDAPGAFQVGDWVSIEHFEAAPRVWIGFENECGRGFRARYWQFDAEDSFHDPILDLTTPTLDSLDAFATLEAYTIDLEYTRRGQHGCWDILGSFGVRNASIQRDEFAVNYVSVTGNQLSSHFQSEFNGTGLTGALEGRRPLGNCGLNFYGNIRGSVLWGPTQQNALSVIRDGAITALQIAQEDEDTTMFIFESQAGLEWSKYLKCFCGTAYARLLFEYQYWNADETSFDFFQQVNGVAVAGSSASVDVDFIGLTFGVGISR